MQPLNARQVPILCVQVPWLIVVPLPVSGEPVRSRRSAPCLHDGPGRGVLRATRRTRRCAAAEQNDARSLGKEEHHRLGDLLGRIDVQPAASRALSISSPPRRSTRRASVAWTDQRLQFVQGGSERRPTREIDGLGLFLDRQRDGRLVDPRRAYERAGAPAASCFWSFERPEIILMTIWSIGRPCYRALYCSSVTSSIQSTFLPSRIYETAI